MERTDWFILYTVPHTGTFFTFRFLSKIGIERGSRDSNYKDYIHMHQVDYEPRQKWERELLTRRLVVTARHPHRTFLSHLIRAGEGESKRIAAKLNRLYGIFLNTLKSHESYGILTLDCEEHLREKTLLDVANFLNVDLNVYGEAIRSYADSWDPFHFYCKPDENIKHNPLISEYEKDPSMIKEYDLSSLRDAINWYEKVRVRN